ncbi:glycosyl hydrolase family 95 catalytic domain-containing protein [Paenibacillus terrigena]|uniref:glycosyl hydrolase family 95 catalytic domain-containing protein n=1 Tax=Paenibacillus terrigena TaxID=369333 RepID=UPI0028D2878F|nr:glycoside hydrolase N-terminal domain-containing protein [Paenibacillus terrigena]
MRKKKLSTCYAAALASAMMVTSVPVMAYQDLSSDGREAKGTSLYAENRNAMKLWYQTPGNNWLYDGLPIGNGNLGAMILGRTETEKVQLNEITLWTGGPNTPNYTGGNVKDAYKALPEVREALFAGKFDEAYERSKKLLGTGKGLDGYQNLGDFSLDFTGNARTSTPTNYRRELDLNEGISRVSYENNGVQFTREYVASNPGNVMAVHLTSDKANEIGFKLRLTPDASANAYADVGKTYTTTARDGVISCQGTVAGSEMKFAVQMKVIAPNADITTNSDGTVTVANGEDVTLYMTAGTNYDQTESNLIQSIDSFKTVDYLDDRDPNGDVAMHKAADRINTASKMSYSDFKTSHIEDYQRLFHKVSLNLGDLEDADRPTNELMRDYQSGKKESRYIETLLFQFGRYLLISSSRNSLPANLQGVWNNSNKPMWSSDYHLNINMQMIYWPAFVTNMDEVANPVIPFLRSLMGPGKVSAKEHYGVDNGGWVVNHTTNIFGITAPGESIDWGLAPGSAAWVSMLLWDYYQYTQDEEILRQIYPILRDQAKFWKDYLVIDPNTGEYVTAPSASPEHGPVGVGSTYDMSVAYMLMEDVVEASKIMGQDQDLRADLEAILAHMDPIKIGKSGQIKEWREEEEYNKRSDGTSIGDPTHRHVSQLMGLYNGDMITREDKEQMDAAIKSLELRGDMGWDASGWSMALRMLLWSRVGDGDRALTLYQDTIKYAMLQNLMSSALGYVYQMDANGGVTAGVAEMLMQSYAGYIEPLPALPQEWDAGSYTGLKAIGDFECDAVWSANNLNTFIVRSGAGKPVKLRYPGIANAKVTSNGANVDFTTIDANTIAFNTTKGTEYVISNIPTRLIAPTQLEAYRLDDHKVDVTWNAVKDPDVTYNVYRMVEGGNYELYASNLTSAKYQDTAANASLGNIYYKVAAVKDHKEGMVSKPTKAIKRNIALKKPVTTNSEQGNNLAVYGNDGDEQSRWCGNSPSQVQWWQVDLQDTYQISGSKFIWESDNHEMYYKIEVSADGSKWETVVNRYDSHSVTEKVTDDKWLAQHVRYIKITFPGSPKVPGNPAVWAGFREFEVYADSKPVVSDNKPAAASSEQVGYEASKANDGDLATAWKAAVEDSKKTWTVDLEDKYDLTEIELEWVAENVSKYKVEVSSDNKVWTHAVDRTKDAESSKVKTDRVANQEVRYVKVSFTEGIASIDEIRVRGTKSVIIPESNNVVFNKPVTTDSQQSGNPASAGNDGDESTRWCVADDKNPHYWQVNLGGKYDVTGSKIIFENGGKAMMYKIEVSSDAATWTTVIDHMNNTTNIEKVRTDNWTAKGAQYIKVTVMGYPELWGGFREFEAYGTKSPVVDTTVLKAAIASAQVKLDQAVVGNQPGQYPQAVVDAFKAAIAAAERVVDTAATQPEVTTAIGALQTAVQAFDKAGAAAPSGSITAPATATAGKTFNVQVGLSSVTQGVYAQDLSIDFDSDTLEFLSASSLILGVSIIDKKTTPDGKLRFIVASVGPGNAVTGTKNVLELKFKAKEVAEASVNSVISMTKAMISDAAGAEMTIKSASTTVQVVKEQPPVATGDLNGDGKVTIGDLAIAAANYGATKDSPNWSKLRMADFDNNGVIDISDLAAIAQKIIQ